LTQENLILRSSTHPMGLEGRNAEPKKDALHGTPSVGFNF
jgi:hypothetical protein